MFKDFINTLMNGGIIVLMMSKVLMPEWTDLRSATPAEITAQRDLWGLHYIEIEVVLINYLYKRLQIT